MGIVNVRILRDRRINKVEYTAGQEVEFPEPDAKWLVDQGIAEYVDAPSIATRAVPTPQPAIAPSRPIAPATPRFKCCGWK